VLSASRESILAIPQYGCYTFAFHKNLPYPVAASTNKWTGDWASHWFYHKVPLDLKTNINPLIVGCIGALSDVLKVAMNVRPEDEAFLAMLYKVSKTFGTRDIIEEFVACDCFPVKARWSVYGWSAEDRWIEGIPVPNFVSTFNVRHDRKLLPLVVLRDRKLSPLVVLYDRKLPSPLNFRTVLTPCTSSLF